MSDYCTLVEVKAELGIAVDDGSDDSRIASAITGVSRTIERYCKRRFYSSNEVRYYTAQVTNSPTQMPYSLGYYSAGYAPYLGYAGWVVVDDLLSVTELATDDGSRTYSTVWATTDYDLGPANNALEGWPYWHIAPAPGGHFAFTVGIPRSVRITGAFGFAATPEDVHQAALFQVCTMFRAKDAPLGLIGGGNVQQFVSTAALHPFAKRLLTPYRNPTVA